MENQDQQQFKIKLTEEIADGQNNKQISPTKDGDYDYSFPKYEAATILGIIVLIATFFLILDKPKNDESNNQLLILGIIRMFCAYYAFYIATRLNRAKFGWAIFAFIIPSIALIIIGRLRKLNYYLIVDESYPKPKIYKAVKSLGDNFISKKMFVEAFKAYQFIDEKLSPTEKDKEILIFLSEKINSNENLTL